MAYSKTLTFKSTSSLHNDHLSILDDSNTIYHTETRNLKSSEFQIDLLDSTKLIKGTARSSASSDKCFVSLEPGKEGEELVVQRVPPDESVTFSLDGAEYTWRCTRNVLGVRDWDLVQHDGDGPLATFEKTRGLLVRRQMGRMELRAKLDPDVERVAVLAILANQERIRLNVQPSSGGGYGG